MAGYSTNPVDVGQKFGRLTVVEICGRSADGHKTWKCVCECGTTCIRQSNNLKSSKLSNCGCALRDLAVKHGMKYSGTYNSWQSAKRRCHTEGDKDFKRYGAVGIQMCSEWRDSFESFFAYMGVRPEGMSLDRFPNTSGNYEPGNCRWATTTEQNRNRRVSTFVDWRGAKTHLSVVASEIGITYGAAFMRLKRGKLHEISL